jgi:DNA-binding MarR family transcriptional regulator
MAQAEWLDDQEMSAWRGWVTVTERVRAAIGRDMARDHGMSDAEYAVLVYLSEAPERLMRMTDLAAGLNWSKSRLSHLITRMESRGLVTKRDCPSDARGSFAGLTDAGLAEITSAAPSHVASVRRHFFDHLERSEISQLDAILAAVLARMDESPRPCPLSDPEPGADPCGEGTAAPAGAAGGSLP